MSLSLGWAWSWIRKIGPRGFRGVLDVADWVSGILVIGLIYNYNILIYIININNININNNINTTI